MTSLLKAYSPYFLLFLSTLFAWIGWSLKTKFATKEIHDELSRRVAEIEKKQALTPTKDDIHEIKLSLATMTERLCAVGGTVERIETIVDRQQDYLLNKR